MYCARLTKFQGLMARRCFPVAKIASSNLVGIVFYPAFIEHLLLFSPWVESHHQFGANQAMTYRKLRVTDFKTQLQLE